MRRDSAGKPVAGTTTVAAVEAGQQQSGTARDTGISRSHTRPWTLRRPRWLPRDLQGWLALVWAHAPFLCSFLVATFLLTINVALPWKSIFEDNGLAFESIAINYIRFGLGAGKGQNVADTEGLNGYSRTNVPGVPNAQQFHFFLSGHVHPYLYPDHPPLFGLTITASLLIFGFTWWAVRLVPILYSLGSVITFYGLMRVLFRRRYQRNGLAIWLSTTLFAIFPMMAYFGRNVAHESAVLFWTLTMLLGYFYWLRDPQRRWLVLMAVSVVAGVLYDWPMCYFACILFAVHWIATRRLSRDVLLATVVPAVATFVLVLAQIDWALGGDIHSVLTVFLIRSGSDTVHQFTWGMWLRQVQNWNRLGYGSWSQYVLPFALAFLIWRFREEGWSRRVAFVTITLLFGLSHIIIFHEGAYFHAYWQFYLLPFYASLFGWAGAWLVQRVVRQPALATVAVVAVALVVFRLNWPATHYLYTTFGNSFVPITHYLFHAG